jgi:hypothetical protein
MLFEADVINAVCKQLESRGYHIRQRLQTTQQGDDIIAVKQTSVPCELYIEAKGETSSRRGSERYGKPFDSAQVRIHVAEAFYKAAEVLSRQHKDVETRVGIALPDNKEHRAVVKKIEPVLNQLEVAVFWVQSDEDVQISSIWEI